MNENHPKVNYGKTGVLLINLGTPDSTGWWDIRKYLKEFIRQKGNRSKSFYLANNIKFFYINI